MQVFQQWRQGVKYDMVVAWDARCRKWYADRYDTRRNAVRGDGATRA
jgi:hypothetical protein